MIMTTEQENIIKDLGIKVSFKEPEYKDHFKEGINRWTYRVRLQRGKKSYSFDFGQSMAAGKKEPTVYDVLCCLTKTDPEDLETFCCNYGYEGVEGLRVYKNVCKEYDRMCDIFSADELDLLSETFY